jgi:hypothetical protein
MLMITEMYKTPINLLQGYASTGPLSLGERNAGLMPGLYFVGKHVHQM